jgi:hypothetical protein
MNDGPSLCATFILLVVLTSSTCGDQYILLSLAFHATTPSGLGASKNGW